MSIRVEMFKICDEVPLVPCPPAWYCRTLIQFPPTLARSLLPFLHVGLPASKGGFLSLVMETGPDTAASLKEMAQASWEVKRKKDEKKSSQN